MSKVFIAAGHHPERPGAGYQGFYEHDEAVRWVGAIMATDENSTVFVQVPSVPLKQKAAFINYRAQPGDVAVEIHFNSFVKDGKNVGAGCVSLYMPDSVPGQKLAEACQGVLAEFFKPNRGVVPGWYRGAPERGAYYFLERTTCPSVILEPEFIHLRESIQGNRMACCAALAGMLRAYVGAT